MRFVTFLPSRVIRFFTLMLIIVYILCVCIANVMKQKEWNEKKRKTFCGSNKKRECKELIKSRIWLQSPQKATTVMVHTLSQSLHSVYFIWADENTVISVEFSFLHFALVKCEAINVHRQHRHWHISAPAATDRWNTCIRTWINVKTIPIVLYLLRSWKKTTMTWNKEHTRFCVL